MKSITQDNHQMESLNQKIATFFEASGMIVGECPAPD